MNARTILVDSEDRRAFALKVIGGMPIQKAQEVTIAEHVAQRTLPQNNRLWLLHTAAAEHVGCSPSDMHEDMLCEHFGYAEVKMPSGVIRRVPLKRSSARDKKEFARFMEFVESFYIAQLGVWLP